MRSFFTTTRYRPHNRKDRRHDLPQLQLTLGNKAFATYDWSLGGFRIDDFKGRPPVGEMMEVNHISYGGETAMAVKSTAVVTRLLIGKNQVAFAFNKLDEKAYELLENASMKRLSRLAKK